MQTYEGDVVAWASEQRELAGRTAALLAHLLKWRYRPERRGASREASVVVLTARGRRWVMRCRGFAGLRWAPSISAPARAPTSGGGKRQASNRLEPGRGNALASGPPSKATLQNCDLRER